MFGVSTWEEVRNLAFEFKEIVQIEGVEVSRIHPWQQRSVKAINEVLRSDSRVVAVRLFGSSVNMRCTMNSDLDLVIRLKPEFCTLKDKNEVSEAVQEACDWNADILWFDTLSETEPIYDAVLKGVRIV